MPSTDSIFEQMVMGARQSADLALERLVENSRVLSEFLKRHGTTPAGSTAWRAYVDAVDHLLGILDMLLERDLWPGDRRVYDAAAADALERLRAAYRLLPHRAMLDGHDIWWTEYECLDDVLRCHETLFQRLEILHREDLGRAAYRGLVEA